MSCTRASEQDLDAVLEHPHSPEALGFLAHCRGCGECADAFERHQAARPVAARPDAAGRAGGPSVGLVLLVAVACVALAGAGWWVLRGRDDSSGGAAAPTPAADATPEASPAPSVLPGPPPSEGFEQARILDDGRVELVFEHKLSVALSQLPEGRPVNLSARVPVELEPSDALAARFARPSGDILDTVGRVAPDAPDRIEVEIPREGLETGIHVLQIKTTERTHLPLRRFMIEIR